MKPQEQVLSALHSELDRVRAARRRRRRAVAGVGCVMLLVGGGWLGTVALRPQAVAPTGGSVGPSIADSGSAEAPALPDGSLAVARPEPEAEGAVGPRVVRIAGEAHSVERVGNRPMAAVVVRRSVPRDVVWMSDGDLLAAFDALGDPVGIVRMEGVTTLARLNPPESSRTR